MQRRFGRTTLTTNRLEWSAMHGVEANHGQQHMEPVFRGLKGGDRAGWGPMWPGTADKIRRHAFYSMLGGAAGILAAAGRGGCGRGCRSSR